MELPCPMQALGVNLSPSRFINRIVLMLTGDRENENEIEKAVLMFYVNCWQASPFMRFKRITKENGSIYKSTSEKLDSRY